MKLLTVFILIFGMSSCSVKRAVKKTDIPVTEKTTDELKKADESTKAEESKKLDEAKKAEDAKKLAESNRLEEAKKEEESKIDSNNDGITDQRAKELNLNKEFSILPNFEITSFGKMYLNIYSGEDHIYVNLNAKYTSNGQLLNRARKEIKKHLSLSQEKGFLENFQYDLLPIGRPSTFQYEDLKKFLDKHKKIDRATIDLPLEIGGRNNLLITKREINSLELIFGNERLMLIQSESLQRGGQSIQWQTDDSIWGQVTAEIKNTSLLYQLAQTPFEVSIKINNINYDLDNKPFKSEEKYKSIMTQSSEVIYMDNGFLRKSLVTSGKSLDDLLSNLRINPKEIIFEENIKDEILGISPLTKFLFVSKGLEKGSKTLAGKKYFLITSTPTDILNSEENE